MIPALDIRGPERIITIKAANYQVNGDFIKLEGFQEKVFKNRVFEANALKNDTLLIRFKSNLTSQIE